MTITGMSQSGTPTCSQASGEPAMILLRKVPQVRRDEVPRGTTTSGSGVHRPKLEPLTEVLETGSAYPVPAISGRPPFKLGVSVVIEDVFPEMDPTELAVVMVPVGSVR